MKETSLALTHELKHQEDSSEFQEVTLIYSIRYKTHYHCWSQQISPVHPCFYSYQGDTAEIACKKGGNKGIKTSYTAEEGISTITFCTIYSYILKEHLLVKGFLNITLTGIFINPKDLETQKNVRRRHFIKY